MNIIEELEREHVAKLEEQRLAPEFGAGDTVRVNVKVIEGERERIQAFDGVCIARDGHGLNESFTVRKISYGEGVERVFPVHSPLIESIQVLRRGQVRRAKLYYLRGRRGKAARIPERRDIRAKSKAEAAVREEAQQAFTGFKRPAGEPDDLTRIEGVTEELAGRLDKLGVITFEQIASFTDEDITRVDEVLDLKGRIEREAWAEQARTLMAEATVEEVPAAEEEADTGDAPAEEAAEPAKKAKAGEPEAEKTEKPAGKGKSGKADKKT